MLCSDCSTFPGHPAVFSKSSINKPHILSLQMQRKGILPSLQNTPAATKRVTGFLNIIFHSSKRMFIIQKKWLCLRRPFPITYLKLRRKRQWVLRIKALIFLFLSANLIDTGIDGVALSVTRGLSGQTPSLNSRAWQSIYSVFGHIWPGSSQPSAKAWTRLYLTKNSAKICKDRGVC